MLRNSVAVQYVPAQSCAYSSFCNAIGGAASRTKWISVVVVEEEDDDGFCLKGSVTFEEV